MNLDNLEKTYVLDDNHFMMLHFKDKDEKKALCGNDLTYHVNETPFGRNNGYCTHCLRRVVYKIPFMKVTI